MSWMELLVSLRQWTYPAAFRIATADTESWHGTLSQIQLQLETLRQILSERTSAENDSETDTSDQLPSERVPDKLAIEAGNSCFWIGRLIRQMEDDGIKSKETRSIKVNLKKLIAVLEDNNIRCIDVEGQAYDDGRHDFEPLGEEELRPDLTYTTIIRCDYPVIMSGNRLLQKANGVVARPA